jgi:leucine dehydrogenase
VDLRDLETGTEHERVVECIEPAASYHAIIAIHSTVLGPAVGGSRLWSYDSTDAALADALRLSRGMTLKCAAAGLDLGGGKAVLMAPPSPVNREPLFQAHGRAIQQLGGRFITGEDVGTSPSDMQYVFRETRYVAGLPRRSGDPSPSTARGVLCAIRAAATHRWRTDSLRGRSVAIQGCGNVGSNLARQLHAAGATIVVTDVDADRASGVATEVGGRTVPPDAIYQVEADVFAPCALGGILNAATVPRLTAAIVAGAANNQLARDQDAADLAARDILYVPDFIANAGGVIKGCREIAGWDQQRAAEHIEAIYDTTLAVLRQAERDGITTDEAARRVAEARLNYRTED